MRTTLTLDDDILKVAHHLADVRKMTLGQVISDLARKGLQVQQDISYEDDFPVFRVPKDAMLITPEHIKRLEDEA